MILVTTLEIKVVKFMVLLITLVAKVTNSAAKKVS